MQGQLSERQDHIAYSLWIGIIVVILTVAIDSQISGRFRLLQSVVGSSWSNATASFAIPCGIYFIFRLVRPFHFTVSADNPPASPLYWMGIVLITFVTAASVFFLAWGASFPSFIRFYRISGIALPLLTVAGFLLVEASIVRSSNIKMGTPLYIDAGLLSALLIPPSILVWFSIASPRSGFTIFIMKMFTSELLMWLIPLAVATSIFLLWSVTIHLRRKFRRSALYRSSVSALWIFGVSGYVVFIVLARRSSSYFAPITDVFAEFAGFAFNNPATYFVFVTLIWMALTGVLYAVLRSEASK